MDIFEWEDGTIVEKPYVEINGQKYYVQDGSYSGGTPVTANNLNEMQNILNENISEVVEITEDTYRKSIKFNNGLMINIIKNYYNNVSITTQWGGIYASSGGFAAGEYLTPFVEQYSVNINVKPTSGNHWFMLFEEAVNELTTPPKIQFLRGTSGQATGTVYVTAIGRWE